MPYKLLVFLVLVSFSVDAQKLAKIKINESISMLMPPDFRPMTNDEIVDRYFTTKRPLALFTDPGLTIDLGVNQSVTQWQASDLAIMKDFYKSNIFSLYDNVQMLNEGLEDINGRKYAYFEFVSTIKADQGSFLNKGAINKYTFIQYTIVNGNTLVFNFSCPSNIRGTWAENARKMMRSVVVKKSLK